MVPHPNLCHGRLCSAIALTNSRRKSRTNRVSTANRLKSIPRSFSSSGFESFRARASPRCRTSSERGVQDLLSNQRLASKTGSLRRLSRNLLCRSLMNPDALPDGPLDSRSTTLWWRAARAHAASPQIPVCIRRAVEVASGLNAY